MGPDLEAALEQAASLLATARDPWWVIGSAAVALHGADPGRVADVDILTSADDAERLLRTAGATRDRSAPRTHFRSVYGRLASSGLAIEIMGGLEVLAGDAWVAVRPRTRVAVAVGSSVVFIPDRQELVAILQRFGRPKDLARAALLC